MSLPLPQHVNWSFICHDLRTVSSDSWLDVKYFILFLFTDMSLQK